MGHNHDNESLLGSLLSGNACEEAQVVRKVVTIGCIINFILMSVKLGVGYWGHSDALVADGYHSLNDFAADIIMFTFVGISFRSPDSKYTYGYGKFETFATMLISTFLLIVAVHIGEEAVENIIAYSNGEALEAPSIWAVVTIIFAMCTKEFLYRYYRHAGKVTDSVALISSAWHHRSDAMASIATLIGVAGATFLGEAWRILDPIASLVIVIFIFVTALRMLMPAFAELMEHTPAHGVQEKAREIIGETAGVESVTKLRCRKNGHFLIIDATVEVASHLTMVQGSEIASDIEHRLADAFSSHILPTITLRPTT